MSQQASEHNTFKANTEARALLAERIFTVKDTGLTYRVLNHWSEVGLIEDDRSDAAGWRKLSVADLLWIRILVKLREYGLSLDKLLRVQTCIFSGEIPERMMENAIGACMAYVQVFLIVWPDGEAEIENEFWLKGIEATLHYPDYLRINLNMMWYELTGDDAKPYFDNIKAQWKEWRHPAKQSDAEAHVLNLMRDDQPQEIHISRHTGQDSFQINTSKRIEGAVQISKALQELQFGEMFIQVAHGKPVLTKLTKKKKIKK